MYPCEIYDKLREAYRHHWPGADRMLIDYIRDALSPEAHNTAVAARDKVRCALAAEAAGKRECTADLLHNMEVDGDA